MNQNQPNQDITNEIEAFLEALTTKNIAHAGDSEYALNQYKVSYGKAYARVSYVTNSGKGQESAHSFVALTDKKMPIGSILKPKGWASPTLNFPRGNVVTKEYNINSPYGY